MATSLEAFQAVIETERACVVRHEERFYRAVVKMVGIFEVQVCGRARRDRQVYLSDYGTTHFIHKRNVFEMPRLIAELAPPLVHFCTVSGSFLCEHFRFQERTAALWIRPHRWPFSSASLQGT